VLDPTAGRLHGGRASLRIPSAALSEQLEQSASLRADHRLAVIDKKIKAADRQPTWGLHGFTDVQVLSHPVRQPAHHEHTI
jgi:hypothetical protein